MNAADDLYGLPLDRFVPERGALAKAMRGEGRREEAARVAALRKPSVAAWTVNQLVRTQRRAIENLMEAGDALQRAQSDLLGGAGDAGALRDAVQRERAAVDELSERARGLLGSEGQEPTQATIDRVADTLHAAALDEGARELVSGGCLDRELRRVGFGEGGGVSAPAPTRGRSDREPADREPAGREPPGRRRAAGAQTDREREQAERDRAAARERAEALKAARRAEADARHAQERAGRELEVAQERRDRAADALRDAEDALAAARERADAAELARRRAHDALSG